MNRKGKKIYLKIVVGDWRNASRDKRELKVADEMGFKTMVIATTKESKSIVREVIDGFDVIRIPTRKYGEGPIKKYISRLASIFIFIKQIKAVNATIISGHNYTGWLLGYIAYGKKKKYIYDSHEFELYIKKRNAIMFILIKPIEKYVLKHSDINMMVADSIADEVKNIYKLKKRPLVIRNIPEQSKLKKEVIERNRREFKNNIQLAEDGTIIIYHGGITEGRGIEESIIAISRLNDVGLVVMGYALNDEYNNKLKKLAESLNCLDRIYFKSAVPFSDLYDYVAAADIGIVLIQNKCKSYYYCLPNKLMENIQAKTPIIGSDFPEIRHIINEYKVGEIVKPDDIDSIVSAIRNFKTNKERYNNYKENLEFAKRELCWEKEKIKLKDAILSII